MAPMSPPDEDVYCTMEADGYEVMTPPRCDFGESTGLRPQPVASFMCYTATNKQDSLGKGSKASGYVKTDCSRKGIPSSSYVNNDPCKNGTTASSSAHVTSKAPLKGTRHDTYPNNEYINDFMEFNFGQEEFRERASSDGKISRPRDVKMPRSPSGSHIAPNNGGRKRSNTFSGHLRGQSRGHAHLNELERQLYSPEKLHRAHSPAHSPPRNHNIDGRKDGPAYSPPGNHNRLDRMDEVSENDFVDSCEFCAQRPEYDSEIYLPLPTTVHDCERCSQRRGSNPEDKHPVKIPCMIVSESKEIPERKAERPKTENPFSLAAYNPNFPDKRTSSSSLNSIPENANVSVNPNYASVDFTPGSKEVVKDSKLNPFQDLMEIDFRSRTGSDCSAMRRKQQRQDENQEQRLRSGSHGNSSSLAKIRSLFTRRKVV